MSSKLINIARRGTSQAVDPHYRYKRALIQTRVNSTPTHCQTHVLNLPEIAQQLKTDFESLVKALTSRVQKRLSCSAVFDISGNKHVACIYFTGEHADQVIDAVLQDMIEKHLLCTQCGLPEYNHETDTCDSCGASRSHGPRPKRAAIKASNAKSNNTKSSNTTQNTKSSNAPTAQHAGYEIPSWEVALSESMNLLYNKRAVLLESVERSPRETNAVNSKETTVRLQALNKALDDAWSIQTQRAYDQWKSSCQDSQLLPR